MDTIKIKIKEVYFPFLIISIGTIFFYNLFRWIFDIKLGILPLKEDLLNFWIPFALPWIPILIWLRRRIRLLKIRGKRDNGYFVYQFAMVTAIAVPIMISQNYIQKGSLGLIEVEVPNEVKEFKNEKYFKINSFQVDHDASLPYVTSRTSGRYNDKLNFHMYLACPFENSNNLWYGVEYHESISNLISDIEKNNEYGRFLTESEEKFTDYDFQKVKYFEKLGYSDNQDGFLEAIKQVEKHIIAKDEIVLVPKSDHFENRLGNTFPWIFGSFGIGSAILLLMVVIPKIDKKEFNDFKKDKPFKNDDLKDIMALFGPRGQSKATANLLLLNIIVFVSMTFSGLNIISPTPKELLEIGGNRRFEVLNGEYWRLFTSIFIHGGMMHLFMNLCGLAMGGILLENILGRARLILSFLVCGILASLTSIYWHENIVSVGASGAIFGLYGLILAFTVFKVYHSNTREMTWILLAFYAGISLLFGLFGGIDNAAHIGGLISGFLIGGLLILIEKEKLLKNAANV